MSVVFCPCADCGQLHPPPDERAPQRAPPAQGAQRRRRAPPPADSTLSPARFLKPRSVLSRACGLSPSRPAGDRDRVLQDDANAGAAVQPLHPQQGGEGGPHGQAEQGPRRHPRCASRRVRRSLREQKRTHKGSRRSVLLTPPRPPCSSARPSPPALKKLCNHPRLIYEMFLKGKGVRLDRAPRLALAHSGALSPTTQPTEDARRRRRVRPAGASRGRLRGLPAVLPAGGVRRWPPRARAVPARVGEVRVRGRRAFQSLPHDPALRRRRAEARLLCVHCLAGIGIRPGRSADGHCAPRNRNEFPGASSRCWRRCCTTCAPTRATASCS